MDSALWAIVCRDHFNPQYFLYHDAQGGVSEPIPEPGGRVRRTDRPVWLFWPDDCYTAGPLPWVLVSRCENSVYNCRVPSDGTVLFGVDGVLAGKFDPQGIGAVDSALHSVFGKRNPSAAYSANSVRGVVCDLPYYHQLSECGH